MKHRVKIVAGQGSATELERAINAFLASLPAVTYVASIEYRPISVSFGPQDAADVIVPEYSALIWYEEEP